jgi:hypothetical protein
MKNTQFVIFFSVFLTLYSLINVYIFFKGWQLFPRPSVSRALYSLLFFTVAFAYVAGRLLEKASICRASSALIWIGSFWLAFMVYLFLGFLLVDTISFVAGFNSTFRRHISSDSGSFRIYSAVAIYCITFLAVFIGHINTYRPAVTTVDIEIKGKSTPLERLNIALVTDIHLGTIVSNSKLTRMVEMVNALQPDIVLLAGDIVDEDIAPVIKTTTATFCARCVPASGYSPSPATMNFTAESTMRSDISPSTGFRCCGTGQFCWTTHFIWPEETTGPYSRCWGPVALLWKAFCATLISANP